MTWHGTSSARVGGLLLAGGGLLLVIGVVSDAPGSPEAATLGTHSPVAAPPASPTPASPPGLAAASPARPAASHPAAGNPPGPVSTAAAGAGPTRPAAVQQATSCIACHGDDDLFEPEEVQVVLDHQDDVHASVGLSCHDCHGGNPDPALAEDMFDAMDEEYGPNPYRGVPAPADVPRFCGTCHSSLEFMRRYRPDARVDQEQEYWTSQHGQALAAGDTDVATCVDCHGAHGTQRPADPASSVYPTRVAETCSGCHADTQRMEGYTTLRGNPLPVDQYALWSESVHAEALLDREDLSAPTCNDCHGNHGAVPPGLDSVAFVCGQCHGREASLFRASDKAGGFQEHNEFLADAGEDGCAACHDAPEPAAAVTAVSSFGECSACHGNHGVVRPTLAFLSPLPDAPCEVCHAAPGPQGGPTEALGVTERFEATREALLDEAAELGLEGNERFDWLVERARLLPAHTVSLAGEEEDTEVPRPEFERLFDKFRIGATSYEYRDPVTGQTTRAPILRCASCHAGEEILGDDAHGMSVSRQIFEGMLELTQKTARAERLLLAARRGGVETGPVAGEVDRAVDAQIELEALLHGFSVAEDSELVARQAEGVAHAEAALEAGAAALEELSFRRRGLVVALAIIVLVLFGLALKIRQLSSARAEP